MRATPEFLFCVFVLCTVRVKSSPSANCVQQYSSITRLGSINIIADNPRIGVCGLKRENEIALSRFASENLVSRPQNQAESGTQTI